MPRRKPWSWAWAESCCSAFRRSRDAEGTASLDPDGVLNKAIRDVRAEVGDDLVIMSDVCLDEFTDHGHCGVLDADGYVDNDRTVEIYARMAVAQADAGAHMLGPSGMMDGQVAVIRQALDDAGHANTAVVAYAAKYASAFYGPFREAVDSQLKGDRRTYQMDAANRREAIREVELDLAEGADMVMVKPAMSYLDIVSGRCRDEPGARGRLPDLGGVRDDRGGGRERLDRPPGRHHGVGPGHPPRRGQHGPDLLGGRAGRLAEGILMSETPEDSSTQASGPPGGPHRAGGPGRILLGLNTFGDVGDGADGSPEPHAQVLRQLLEQAELADAVGLHAFGVGEHHRQDFAVSAPEVFLAAAAGADQADPARLGRHGAELRRPHPGLPALRHAWTPSPTAGPR